MDVSQHLVLDLHGIPSVEEGLLIEQGIPHGCRVRIQRALGAQRRRFAVWPPSHCVCNYVSQALWCQGYNGHIARCSIAHR